MAQAHPTVRGVVIALGLLVAAAMGGCSDSPDSNSVSNTPTSSPASQVYGVWRVTESSFSNVTITTDVAVFVEFAETTITIYRIGGGVAKLETPAIQWSARGNVLDGRSDRHNREVTLTFGEDAQTMAMVLLNAGGAETATLTRSSPTELNAAKK